MSIANSILGGGRSSGSGRDRDSRRGDSEEYNERDYDAPPAEYEDYRITQIQLIETGTYTPEYIRSYVMGVTKDDLNDLHDIVDDLGTGRVNSDALSGLASSILKYERDVKDTNLVEIDNGWDSKRLSFLIEVVERGVDEFDRNGKVLVTFITGYTDRIDFARRSNNASGRRAEYALPNDLEFHVTNVHRIEKSSGRILSDFQVISPNRYNDAYRSGSTNDLYTLRPKDIMNNEFINERGDDIRRHNNSLISVNASNVLKGTAPKTSRARNNTATHYLADVVNAGVAAENSERVGTGRDYFGNSGSGRAEDRFTTAASWLQEANLFERNSFLSLMRKKGRNFSTRQLFTWGELGELFGYDDIDRVSALHISKEVQKSRTARGRLSDHQDTAGWDTDENDGLNAMFATVLKQALPGLALESMIYACRIEATNILRGSAIDYAIKGVDITVSNIIFITKLPTSVQQEMRNHLQERIASQLLHDLSMRNRIEFDLVVELDWRNDSFYNVSIDGGDMIDFSSPNFSNSLTSPILTLDSRSTQRFGTSIREMVDAVLKR